MSKSSMQFMSSMAFPVRGGGVAVHVRTEPVVVTGQTDEAMQLFAGLHKSKRFTVDAAHQSFAGLKRKK